RPAMTPRAPALARRTAMALPIPLPALVTTPILPSKLTIDSPPSSAGRDDPPLSHFGFSLRRSDQKHPCPDSGLEDISDHLTASQDTIEKRKITKRYGEYFISIPR